MDGGRLPLLLRCLPGARGARGLESFSPALLFHLLTLLITLSFLQRTAKLLDLASYLNHPYHVSDAGYTQYSSISVCRHQM